MAKQYWSPKVVAFDASPDGTTGEYQIVWTVVAPTTDGLYTRTVKTKNLPEDLPTDIMETVQTAFAGLITDDGYTLRTE